ncbi:MAG: ATP-binding cassette domain-containing protein [Gemmatimonadota bacterium]|nr:ATP-binding cassette domain-containing protein [Gemmatimonadota bacterium]
MIRVENLSKTFKVTKQLKKELGVGAPANGLITAVDNINFECKPGRVFGLLGPNGAGKTTALRMIATMLKPTSGRIEVAGIDAMEEPQKVRANIGFLTGNTGLYDRLTATEMVRYHARLHGMDEKTFEERRRLLFSQLGMESFADRRIARLSTGMRQKVSIARTIISDPGVIVFDEPTSGLDVMTSRGIVNLIRQCRDQGNTVLFSTHIMSEVQLLCDDIAIIHRGKLYFNGSREEFESGMTHDSYEDEFIHLVGEE